MTVGAHPIAVNPVTGALTYASEVLEDSDAVLQTLADAKGDLVAASAADTFTRLAVGSDGQFLRAASGQATGLQWDTLDAADIPDLSATYGTLSVSRMRTRVELFEDFLTGASGSSIPSTVNGTGAAVNSTATDSTSHVGIAEFDTGTTNTGRAGVLSTATALHLGGGTAEFEALVQFPTLSDGSETYSARIGFIDLTSGSATDGVYFEYDSATHANWRTVTASNSTRTSTNTATAVAAGTWYRLRAAVNAGGTSVSFFINEVDTGTAHTTNIPTGASRFTGMGMGIVKSAGTTSRTMWADYFAVLIKFTSAR